MRPADSRRDIGIRHEVLTTGEFSDPNYTANPANRCYFCKTELYEQIEPLAKELGLDVIVNGANADDAGDWRPAWRLLANIKCAARFWNVASPRPTCELWRPSGNYPSPISRHRRAFPAAWLTAKKLPPSDCK